jgi:3'-phosphoadenosine 5'-phosphosulfate sulfotransferase (PAPS reductase)/FAD synthetase
MLFKDNWLTTNVSKNPVDPFQVTVKKSYADINMPFAKAAEENILEIERLGRQLGKRPYLSLSGGSDSMYILRLCARLNIRITPVIVCVVDNPVITYDTNNAIAECNKLEFVPHLIELTEKEHFALYCRELLPMLGVGSQSVSAPARCQIRCI